MNEELDSQLSAMFDDELAPAECELLARRLSRDEQLKARWGRYAMIGATIRAEGGARLSSNLARRVSLSLSAEPALAGQSASEAPGRMGGRWRRPVMGAAVAASVAAASILWMRFQGLPEPGTMVAQSDGPVALVPGSGRAVATADSYVVPKAPERRAVALPMTELANYVVAHSEFSSPVTRRNLLSALVATESGTTGAPSGSEEPIEDTSDDAKNVR